MQTYFRSNPLVQLFGIILIAQKMSHCAYRAVLDCLNTKDKIKLWQPQIDTLCVLCGEQNESIQRIF